MHHHNNDNHDGHHHNGADADAHNERGIGLLLLTTTEVLRSGVLDVRIDLTSIQSSLEGTEDAVRRNDIRSEVDDHVRIEAQMEETRLVEVVVIVEHDSVSTDIDTHELPFPHNHSAVLRDAHDFVLHVDSILATQRVGDIVGENLDEQVVARHFPVLPVVRDTLDIPRVAQMEKSGGTIAIAVRVISGIELKERRNTLNVSRKRPCKLASYA